MDNNYITPPPNPTPDPLQQPITPQQPISSNPAITALPAQKPKSSIVETIVLISVCVLAAIAIVLAVIFFLQWNEAKSNVDGKVDAAVATLEEEIISAEEAKCAEREALPNNEFTGPSDYGSLNFMYPKTWSIYIAKDASSGGDFDAYFNPGGVNPVSDDTINALRFHIYNKPFDEVISSYANLVKRGSLTSSTCAIIDSTTACNRYEGAFTKNITGIAVLIKVNDKTALLRTDSTNFKADFDKLVATITIN